MSRASSCSVRLRSLVADARSEDHTLAGRRRLFEAEQTEVLVRVAADSGARRSELASLRLSDPEVIRTGIGVCSHETQSESFGGDEALEHACGLGDHPIIADGSPVPRIESEHRSGGRRGQQHADQRDDAPDTPRHGLTVGQLCRAQIWWRGVVRVLGHLLRRQGEGDPLQVGRSTTRSGSAAKAPAQRRLQNQ